jgi:hypothetical protein
LARWRSGEVRLSQEHASFRWTPLADALAAIPFPNLRGVLERAALFAKDAALFARTPATEAEADVWLRTLPAATEPLLAHVRGGARLARRFAEALRGAGRPVHVEAAAAGALLHDTGRALDRHGDHPLAGLEHVRGTRLAPYGFACVSHFTKGATFDELLGAGLGREEAERLHRAIDCRRLTWEEKCVALADSCMRGSEAVPPRERFGDLRVRYHGAPVVDLQERRTEALRREIAAALGMDPLGLVGLG